MTSCLFLTVTPGANRSCCIAARFSSVMRSPTTASATPAQAREVPLKFGCELQLLRRSCTEIRQDAKIAVDNVMDYRKGLRDGLAFKIKSEASAEGNLFITDGLHVFSSLVGCVHAENLVLILGNARAQTVSYTSESKLPKGTKLRRVLEVVELLGKGADVAFVSRLHAKPRRGRSARSTSDPRASQ
jgi:hypothetical protein